MAAMVVMERHLWLNLVDIKEKENNFSPSELLGTSVELGHSCSSSLDARRKRQDLRKVIKKAVR